jgi:CubicO group peptidase (beta-lactamase class C family)
MALVRCGALLGVFAWGEARRATVDEPALPAAADTLYRVASVAKLVCAMGAMALVERGILALDADIGDALGYPVRNPAFPDAPVTLRQLLTHTAGLLDAPQYNGPGIAGKATLRELLTPPNAAKNFAQTAPGAMFRYSNLGAGIVGSLLEAVTGARFDDAMQRFLFEPLGIAASFVPQRLLLHAGRLARGYYVKPLRAPRLAYDAPALAAEALPDFDPEKDFMHAPGRLILSVPDLAKIARLLCSDGAVDGVRVLAPQSMEELRAPQVRRGSVGGDAGRGLGVAYAPGVFGRKTAVGHQGVAYGMNAEVWGDPATGDAVAMVTNGALLRSVGTLTRCGWAVTRMGFEALSHLK